jgi:hypothetical protein
MRKTGCNDMYCIGIHGEGVWAFFGKNKKRILLSFLRMQIQIMGSRPIYESPSKPSKCKQPCAVYAFCP